MNALSDVLAHLPEAERANYARIAGKYGITENAPELISASLILEAVGARVDAALQQMDERLAAIRELDERIPEGMRAAAIELSRNTGTDTASAIRTNVESSIHAALDVLADSQSAVLVHMGEEVSAHCDDLSSKAKAVLDESRAALQEHLVKINAISSAHQSFFNEHITKLAVGAGLALLLAAGGAGAIGYHFDSTQAQTRGCHLAFQRLSDHRLVAQADIHGYQTAYCKGL